MKRIFFVITVGENLDGENPKLTEPEVNQIKGLIPHLEAISGDFNKIISGIGLRQIQAAILLNLRPDEYTPLAGDAIYADREKNVVMEGGYRLPARKYRGIEFMLTITDLLTKRSFDKELYVSSQKLMEMLEYFNSKAGALYKIEATGRDILSITEIAG